ncbi:MAG: hypothetical protein QOH89_2982 [Pseudonocardiales bacterium]|nr:hypothetical protein [Pseudonocardiales bacterium]
MTVDQVREIADAVLYEGYLLYPYRASSSKNRSRWQFGVLGPPQATSASYAEDPGMSMQCLLRPRAPVAAVTIRLRFLQLQVREVQRLAAPGQFEPVDALDVDGTRLLTWDEAVEREFTFDRYELDGPVEYAVAIPADQLVEPVHHADGSEAGRIVRRREALTARVRAHVEAEDGFIRLGVSVDNEHPDTVDGKDAAIRVSLIGAHILVEAHDAAFVSLLDPPEEAKRAAGTVRQHRCYPVLAGPAGSTDIVLGAPIILYDYPEIAAESKGALFDGTEIDEILTLRVMTMTDAEKAEARATDPRAREIIDRCDAMSAADMQQLHGILRNPHAVADPPGPRADLRDIEPADFDTGGAPWWDPAADAAVRPEADAVVIEGIPVSRGSLVRVHPSRRADAQDLFFAGQIARVQAVLSDVDGDVHVALVLVDDPAGDLHEWYGRYFYFSPDELEPLAAGADFDNREESRS